MDINIFNECEIAMENELVQARRRFVSESTVAVEIQLKPGGEIPEHGTPESVFFYVLQGTGRLSIDGEEADAVPGIVTHCPAEVKKMIKNTGDALLKVLVVKMN